MKAISNFAIFHLTATATSRFLLPLVLCGCASSVARHPDVPKPLNNVIAMLTSPMESGRPLNLREAILAFGVPKKLAKSEVARVISVTGAPGLQARPGYIDHWHIQEEPFIESIDLSNFPKTDRTVAIRISFRTKPCLKPEQLVPLNRRSHPSLEGTDGARYWVYKDHFVHGTYLVITNEMIGSREPSCVFGIVLDYEV